MVQAVAKMQCNERKTNLLGYVKYCVISLEKIVRAIIPFGEFFVLISFDGSTSKLGSLIREQVIPLLLGRRCTPSLKMTVFQAGLDQGYSTDMCENQVSIASARMTMLYEGI